jgi:hypothetical protein
MNTEHFLAWDRKNGNFYDRVELGTLRYIMSNGNYANGTLCNAQGFKAVAHDPVSDVFWAMPYPNAAGPLQKLDITDCSVIAQLASPGAEIWALALDPQHKKLYGLGNSTHLYSYDIASDTWSTVADTGVVWGDFTFNGPRVSIAFDPAARALYVSQWPGNFAFPPQPMIKAGLYKMSPETGAFTKIGAPPFSGGLTWWLPPDNSQCFVADMPCGPFIGTCGPYQVCKDNDPPPDSAYCVSVKPCANYCATCSCLGSFCTSEGRTCTSADNQAGLICGL